MLADLTTLLHETTDSLRDVFAPSDRRAAATAEEQLTAIWLTGLPSRGKQRLEAALAASNLTVLSANTVPPAIDGRAPSRGYVHVHAETDLDALLEPSVAAKARATAAAAALVIPSDWESPAHSVRRVLELLRACNGR